MSTNHSRHLRQAEFASPGPLREKLIAKILAREKHATSSLHIEYQLANKPLPTVGERQHVVNSQQQPIAVIEITAVEVRQLHTVDFAFAHAEGEGFQTVKEWRTAHEAYWSELVPGVRQATGDSSWSLDDKTEVVLERFRCLNVTVT